MNAKQLRNAAVTQTLFAPATLAGALRTLGFVQADPIRAPARAQDLILRHRVNGYRAGDLERRFARLDIEEGILYAYGFLSKAAAELAHPHDREPLSDFAERVLAIVREHGPLHPSDMQRWFARDRVLNAWGGQSIETTQTLERLRRRGHVRVVRRDAGIRVYGAIERPHADAVPPADERTRGLIALVADILGPVPERTLSGIAAYIVARVVHGESGSHRRIMKAMLADAQYVREEIDGLAYWRTPRKRAATEPERVRLLAPFDPIVWDRRRFEHIWRWEYRFEAYVPPAKRIRGYYALPLLWKADVIGWANARVVDGILDVDLGYVDAKPRDRTYGRELRAELERLEVFLMQPR